MNFSALSVTILWLTIISPAHSVEPVTVLGLPLGSGVGLSTRQCKVIELGTDVKSLCWVDSPQLLDGSRTGSIAVPGSDSRPKWAAFGTFEATISNNGTLRSFAINTSDGSVFEEIRDSVAARFGSPKTESRPGARLMSAEWDRDDVYIRLNCAVRSGCHTRFVSAAWRARHVQEMAARKAKDTARPATP